MKKLLVCLLSLLTISCATLKSPVIIAHRGASGYLPEHSLSAVTAAHFMDVDYIEQDVVLSKDNIPIVLHDIHLETVTDVEEKFPRRQRKDGKYYAIDFTLKELKQLSLHERTRTDDQAVFSKRFPVYSTPEKIPTLAEEIKWIQSLNKSRNKDIGIYVEIKKPEFHQKENRNISSAVLSVLKKYGYEKSEHKAFIQCFEPNTLKSIRSKTNLKLVQLIGENSWQESSADYKLMMTPEGLDEIATYAEGIGPYAGYFLGDEGVKNKHLIVKAKKLGLEIHPFTFRADALPPSFSSYSEFVKIFTEKLEVTGLFTDHPDITRQVIEN